jgi:hypothetical protein
MATALLTLSLHCLNREFGGCELECSSVQRDSSKQNAWTASQNRSHVWNSKNCSSELRLYTSKRGVWIWGRMIYSMHICINSTRIMQCTCAQPLAEKASCPRSVHAFVCMLTRQQGPTRIQKVKQSNRPGTWRLSWQPWRRLNSQPGQITPLGLNPAVRIPLVSYPVTKV